jgi:rod shape-determining protein MreC
LLRGKLIKSITTAAIFIALEVAALTMLNNNGTIQQTWFARIGQGFMGWVWGTTQTISDYFSLADQNDALARENHELYMKLVGKENEAQRDSLAALLPTKDTIDGFHYMSSKIRKISNNSQHNYMILDKGSNDGVKTGYGVITVNGVIGIIDTVSENFSYARSFKNHQMSISSRLGREGMVGRLRWDGASTNKAILREIPHHIQNFQGDTVYTSGYSGKFPAGIPLGTAGSATIVNGSTYEIEVTLFEDFNAIRYAIIVGNLGNDEISNLEKTVQ